MKLHPIQLVLASVVAGLVWYGVKLKPQQSLQFKQPVGESCSVLRVSDGDTIAVDCNGKTLKIRFCGMDAPEKSQPMGQDSKQALARLIDGQKVTIKPIETDRYGRTAAEVWVNHKNLNQQMIKSGMAYVYDRYVDNCPSKDKLFQAQAIAQQNKAGVWSKPGLQKPWEYRAAKRK